MIDSENEVNWYFLRAQRAGHRKRKSLVWWEEISPVPGRKILLKGKLKVSCSFDGRTKMWRESVQPKTACYRGSTNTACYRGSTKTACYRGSTKTACYRGSTKTARYRGSTITACCRDPTKTACYRGPNNTAGT